jgi:hypothetical protein
MRMIAGALSAREPMRLQQRGEHAEVVGSGQPPSWCRTTITRQQALQARDGCGCNQRAAARRTAAPRSAHFTGSGRNFPCNGPFCDRPPTTREPQRFSKEATMHGIIYLVGLIVVIMAILSFFGLR